MEWWVGFNYRYPGLRKEEKANYREYSLLIYRIIEESLLRGRVRRASIAMHIEEGAEIIRLDERW